MIELISGIIFLISTIIVGVIVLRKIPILKGMPEVVSEKSLGAELGEKIKGAPGIKNISFEMMLHKTLSKVRILTLKTDSKTSTWLQQLREKSQKKKLGENENYWKEVKKTSKKS